MKKKLLLFILFLFAFCNCIIINKINIIELKKVNPSNSEINTGALVNNSTIWSIDNIWYITPALNYLKHGVYAIDVNNPLTKVRRTPGYPIFLGIHFMLFGEDNAYDVIPYTQSLLYAFSVLCLWFITLILTNKESIAWIASILYAICPFTISFVFFTITEAIYPAFIVFTLYFLMLYIKSFKNYLLLLSGLFGAIAMLVRPLNILLLLIIPIIVLLHQNKQKGFLLALIYFTMGVGIVELPWLFRNYKVTNGEIIPLEEFYDEPTMGMGRSQNYFDKWEKCFANPNSIVMVNTMIKDNKLPDSLKYVHIDNYLNGLPNYAFSGYDKEQAKHVLINMQNCYRDKELAWGTSLKAINRIDPELECDLNVQYQFADLINKFKRSNFFHYYIVAPYIIRGKISIFNSFSYSYISLNPPNNNLSLSQKIIKTVLYCLNVSLILSLISMLFSNIERLNKVILIGFPLLIFIFIVNFMHIEVRYFLGAYPFFAISLAITSNLIYQYFVKLIGMRTAVSLPQKGGMNV